jgi:hypothetical protein
MGVAGLSLATPGPLGEEPVEREIAKATMYCIAIAAIPVTGNLLIRLI